MYHWEQTRALTNRERIRLQTFPDDFILQEAKKARSKLVWLFPPAGAQIILKRF